jgi:hypothetical protein
MLSCWDVACPSLLAFLLSEGIAAAPPSSFVAAPSSVGSLALFCSRLDEEVEEEGRVLLAPFPASAAAAAEAAAAAASAVFF